MEIDIEKLTSFPWISVMLNGMPLSGRRLHLSAQAPYYRTPFPVRDIAYENDIPTEDL